MIRNLKILVLAAMALAALGVLGASGTQAAEFHCSVSPCQVTMKPDGTGKTAHHVIDLYGGFTTTCTAVTGEATLSEKTSTELTIGNIQGEGCSFLGQPAFLISNGCHYLLKAAGTLTVVCPAGKVIENQGGLGCTYNIPPQGPLPGISYHNVESGVTIEISIKEMAVESIGPGCGGEYTKAQYTTGNVLLTSETDPGGVMANFSWE